MGSAVARSGARIEESSREVFELARERAGVSSEAILGVLATGYGRDRVPMGDERMTEISCHARGCHHYFPEPVVVVDIGGQDSKVMRLAADGTRKRHRMNRKCAAGTGSFLEEVARRLDTPLEGLDGLARGAKRTARISSYCTVFAATELLERVRRGEPLDEVVRGMFVSLVERVIEMDRLDGKVVCTGGVVAHNPMMVELLKEKVPGEVVVAPHPQEMGAFGAALLMARKARGSA